MSNIQAISTNVVPAEEQDANKEFDHIIADYKISNILKEISRYRIWRLRKNDRWKGIEDDYGDPMYETWEDVVISLSEHLDCGRQQIYDRVRIYEQLFWLGYTAEESIKMVADKPYLYARTLDMTLDWNQREEQPRVVKIPSLSSASEDEVKEGLRDLLDNVETFDRQKDALRYVSESVLAEPQVDLYYDGDVIRVTCSTHAIDENGETHMEDYQLVTFYPDSQVPSWARDKLERLFKSVGKYHKGDTTSKQNVAHQDN